MSHLSEVAAAYVIRAWDDEIVPALIGYIAIPNVSPAYEPEWAELGHMDQAVEMFRRWAADRPIAGISVRVHEIEGRTPVLLVEIPSSSPEPSGRTALLYGHLDKQPEMTGWDEGKGPWIPVMESDRLYGRGGADDGYAMFASLAAIEALVEAGGTHERIVVLVEASEESGSPDLPAHVEALAADLGAVDLVVCLDSGCADYDHLWVTTSLRGVVGLTLEVSVLEEGVHSGSASGVVPSSFRIARALLDRLEDSATGEMLLPELQDEIPDQVREQVSRSAEAVAGDLVFPFTGSTRPVVDDPVELLLNRTWRSTLSVVGFDGAPAPGSAGNVLRPSTRLQLSLRLPPLVDADQAAQAVVAALTADPPYEATVAVTDVEAADGWAAPPLEPWLAEALDVAGELHFGSPAGFLGEGGSIPFMGMLGERFPDAQFVVTGVLGPGSNAHGPNEFLDLSLARRLTACVASLLDSHAQRDSRATTAGRTML
ncbi:MAG: M20/M25/M40 family metallo-hydrolase [Actinomycetota bacterium]|jgi:acetylornithine deacetylase/succinyl-diaminopimelate desuccinylase-like protein|nr:M20/M25/M40 family metallo-hydrolase [Actinomycetota bacterium]